MATWLESRKRDRTAAPVLQLKNIETLELMTVVQITGAGNDWFIAGVDADEETFYFGDVAGYADQSAAEDALETLL